MQSLKPSLLLVLAALVTGCSGTDDGPAGGGPAGTPSGSGPAAAAEYAVSCHGDVTARSLTLDLGVGPRCAGGDGGTRCGSPCAPMDAQVRYEPPAMRCGVTNVFVWDGAQCKALPTQTNEGAMKCRGADCPRLFKSEMECRAAYAQCL